MKRDTKSVGDRAEAHVLAALLRAGKVVLRPFGDNQRYDLVIDENGQFVRVQVKSALLKKGAVVFRTCSTHYHRGGKSRDYRGQADLFGVYCPIIDKVYLVLVDHVSTTEGALRIDLPKNGQKKGIRFASAYEVKFSPL